ncbi:hypothetical protein QBC42DRAFT_327915 [Cladorrhinum samala]|uniref:Protein kinase domain-containing protein n=1 Tax=Cladorrhinum samala TaxID=585594 RepID=A0AAV9I447_9PEZI|nr:hypothetical protein QBC42DRAFT_327915 [Cladorrhinum samala]
MAEIHNLETLKNGGYKDAPLTSFKLTCSLPSFPLEIFEFGSTLTHLDLSGTGLSSLPANFSTALPNLKILFLSSCNFTTFPSVLSTHPNLSMVAFRSNRMTSIPEDSLPLNLRWLILTDNLLPSLPSSLGTSCPKLQKLMLSGNLLTSLPESMSSLANLSLLRLSANRFSSLPKWLLALPKLAFLSFAGNPCSAPKSSGAKTPFGLEHVPYSSLTIHSPPLGEGASGVISRADWARSPAYSEEVAVKVFRGRLTSDGTPADEMAACLAAGSHESLITVLGKIDELPAESDRGGAGGGGGGGAGETVGGIVMSLIPDDYKVLGRPPSFDTCTRDVFPDSTREVWKARGEAAVAEVVEMLIGLAGAGEHLHRRGIMHGDFYAHNVLVWKEGKHALLGDFGGATVYAGMDGRDEQEEGEEEEEEKEDKFDGSRLEKLEVLAFGWLVDDWIGLLGKETAEESAPQEKGMRKGLEELRDRCVVEDVQGRPTFEEIVEVLEGMMGWRAMMRIPEVPN